MMSSENVHCNSASVVPSLALSGPVNSVQTYCGLEIAIIAITPRMSWFQRLGMPGRPLRLNGDGHVHLPFVRGTRQRTR